MSELPMGRKRALELLAQGRDRIVAAPGAVDLDPDGTKGTRIADAYLAAAKEGEKLLRGFRAAAARAAFRKVKRRMRQQWEVILKS